MTILNHLRDDPAPRSIRSLSHRALAAQRVARPRTSRMRRKSQPFRWRRTPNVRRVALAPAASMPALSRCSRITWVGDSYEREVLPVLVLRVVSVKGLPSFGRNTGSSCTKLPAQCAAVASQASAAPDINANVGARRVLRSANLGTAKGRVPPMHRTAHGQAAQADGLLPRSSAVFRALHHQSLKNRPRAAAVIATTQGCVMRRSTEIA